MVKIGRKMVNVVFECPLNEYHLSEYVTRLPLFENSGMIQLNIKHDLKERQDEDPSFEMAIIGKTKF